MCRSARIYFILLFLAVGAITTREPGYGQLPQEEIVQRIDQAQLFRERHLDGYEETEHYTARTSRFREAAELTATVFYQKGRGKKYKVISRQGPGFLQYHVLDRILEEETKLSQDQEQSKARLTSANYGMKVEGEEMLRGRRCYVIALLPKGQDTQLLKGKAWVDAQDFSFVRVEGSPTASPSFWTGRPFVERDYLLLNHLSFPQHSRATCKGFLIGKSELDVEYSAYEIFLSKPGG